MIKEFDSTNHPRIICVGCGGAGNNIINRLSMLGGVMGAETIALNTDRQHLENIQADKKFVIGKELTKGLRAGGDPNIGWEAAQEDRHNLKDPFKDANLVFVVAGMGGGTGTGSAPVVAEVARECGALVVGVVTLPFRMEGYSRFEKAIQGLEAFRRYANTVITLDQNKLLQLVPNMPIDYAFSVSDEVIAEMIKGITENITQPSLVNLSYVDVNTIMQDGGVAVIGVGESNTKNRVEEAIYEAINCKLLDFDYRNAKSVLVQVSSGSNMALNEANRVGKIVNSIMNSKTKIIMGAKFDERLKDSIQVRLIITGVNTPYTSGRAARRKRADVRQIFGRSIDWESYGIDLNELFAYTPIVSKGIALSRLRETMQNITYFDNILKNDPNNIDALISKGTAFSRQGDYKEAIIYYDKVLEIEPNNIDALISKGTALSDLEKYKGAIECYDKILGIGTNIVYLPALKGIALFGLEKYDKAMEYFDDALDIDPNNIYLIIIKGLALYNLEKYKESIAYLDKALEINPKNAGIICNKSEALIELNELDEAKEICNSLKARTDLEGLNYSWLMNLYSKLNDYKSVDEVFEKSQKSDEIKDTYIKILKINAEPNLKEKERMQTDLDESNRRLMEETILRKYWENKKLEDHTKKIIDKVDEKDKKDEERFKSLKDDHKVIINTINSMNTKIQDTFTTVQEIDIATKEIGIITLETGEVLKTIYPDEFIRIKERLRKELEL